MCVWTVNFPSSRLRVWKHIHSTQTVFLEFLSTRYYYCIQTIRPRAGRGGRGTSGDQADFLFIKKKKKKADEEGGEARPRVNSLRSRHFFPWQSQTQQWLNPLTGSVIPDTAAGHLSRPADLIPSMEEAIWERSSITASSLGSPTGEQLKLPKTMALLSFQLE